MPAICCSAGLMPSLPVLKRRAFEFKDTPQVGRTHGIHAEPTSFGLTFALWYDEMRRNRERLERARAAVAVGKISGAVGAFALLDPEVEEKVCARLGLKAAPRLDADHSARHLRGIPLARWRSSPHRWRSLPCRSGTGSELRCAKRRNVSAKGRRDRAPCRTSAIRSSQSASAVWRA